LALGTINQMMKSEGRMTKQSFFVFSHNFDIRHSCFVIPPHILKRSPR